MESMSSAASSRRREPNLRLPQDLVWRCWPLRDDAPRSLLVALGVLAIGVATGVISRSILLGVLAVVALTVSLWRFFVPVTYRLGPGGVAQQSLGRQQRVPWKLILSYEIQHQGIVYSLYPDVIPLDAFRTLYVPWGRHKQEVLDLTQRYLSHLRVSRPVE